MMFLVKNYFSSKPQIQVYCAFPVQIPNGISDRIDGQFQHRFVVETPGQSKQHGVARPGAPGICRLQDKVDGADIAFEGESGGLRKFLLRMM
jgi:hypothetical protein